MWPTEATQVLHPGSFLKSSSPNDAFHRLPFSKHSWCQPSPNCPWGKVGKAREGQPQEEICCLLLPNQLLGAERWQWAQQWPGTVLKSQHPSSWAFPHSHSKNICPWAPRSASNAVQTCRALSPRSCIAGLHKRSTVFVPLCPRSCPGHGAAQKCWCHSLPR